MFLKKVLDELNFLTTDEAIRNIVPPIKAIPGSPKTNDNPGLGEMPAANIAAAVKTIATIKGTLMSFLRKVTAKKNNEIGMLKY